MPIQKRQYLKTPSELMTNVDSVYLRDVISTSGLNLSDLSLAMGYNAAYLYTCAYDGRMCREHLDMLADILGFPVEKALVKKRKTKKKR